MMPVRDIRLFLVAIPLLQVTPQSYGFQISGQQWASAEASFYTAIPGDTLWQAAFEEAISRWNESSTNFQFSAIDAFADACTDEGDNGVMFVSTICGENFGSSLLAVTLSLFEVGSGNYIETDIVFNSNKEWDVYSGPLQLVVNDFRRVAVHELGHALGLNHDVSNPAIMNPIVGTTETPLEDDINGVNTIYATSSQPNCGTPVTINPNDTISGNLTSEDCTVNDIDPEELDDSLVDLYQVTLPVAGSLTVTMTSTQLDSFLVLSNKNLNTLFAFDDDSGGGLNARIVITLDPGTYVVIANTAADFAQTGPYTLTTSFQASAADSDGDGLDDSWEINHFGDVSRNGTGDEDGDGLNNLGELNAGTDPNRNDSDNDGLPDKFEVDNGLNPLSNDATLDLDGDGFSNLAEFQFGSDPNDPNSQPSAQPRYSPAIDLLLLSP